MSSPSLYSTKQMAQVKSSSSKSVDVGLDGKIKLLLRLAKILGGLLSTACLLLSKSSSCVVLLEIELGSTIAFYILHTSPQDQTRLSINNKSSVAIAALGDENTRTHTHTRPLEKTQMAFLPYLVDQGFLDVLSALFS